MKNLPNVLIVDDDPTHRKLMGMIADHIFIRPVIVATAEAGLLAMTVEEFDLILMDWRMPEMDGIDCALVIRAIEADKGKHTPIIVVTAKVMPGDREFCLRSGMDDYLAKPFTLIEITTVIARWTSSLIEH